MTISFAPMVVFVVGILVYALSSNAKVQEIGRAGVWVGLLWLTAGLAHIRF